MRVRSVPRGSGPGLLVLVAALGVVAPSASALPSSAAPQSLLAKDLRRVDTSPSTSVVARAPRAVSVTFDAPPERDDAELKIFGPDGEVSAAQPQFSGTAIRRPLDRSVPGGRYVVKWKARSEDGDLATGSFSFIAARGTGTFAEAPARPTDEPAPVEPDATPTAAPAVSSPAASVTATASASVTEEAAVPVPGAGPGSVPPAGGSTAGDGGSLSAGLKLVPVALGGLLVLASAGVGLMSARRHGQPVRRPQLLVRGLPLPWQRHES